MTNDYLDIHSARYDFILSSIKNLNLKSGSKVLDLGCYPPHLFKQLELMSFDVYGVSSEHEKLSHPKVETLNLETDVLPDRFSGCNLVILSEVLEHLASSPQHLIHQVTKILAPGGYFIITTPNVLRIQNLVKLILGQNIYFPIFQLSEHINFRHNREYTLTEVISLFKDQPYQITRSGFFISYPPNRKKNQYDSLPLKIVKYLNYFFMRLIPSKQDTLLLILQKT